MKSKTVVSILIVILGIGGLMWWGRSAQSGATVNSGSNSNQSANTLTSVENFYDFGKISMAKGLVEKTFEITNSSNQEITLERVTTSCMCTSAYLSTATGDEKGPFGMVGHGGTVPKANEVIKAGESRRVRVVFDPNAHGPAGVGIINRVVTLEDNLGGTLEFQIKAVVTP
ncbi:MAG: DUF1573 domain-containing protein [Patescibacteria group bacterium]